MQKTRAPTWEEHITNWAKKHPKISYYLVLYCAVIVGFFGINATILAAGHECIWNPDAEPLFLNFLVWEGEALRSAFASLVAGNGFEFPLYTYSMGYGTDTIMTMAGNLNDPLNLLAAFVPASHADELYVVQIVIRMLLAATTFSAYCFSRGHGRKATGIATLVFVFCGFLVFWGAIRHPKFMNWGILLPLVFLGADRIFEKKNPAPFIAAMALNFLVTIYFAYMSCLGLLVYCLVKYFFAPRARSPKDFAALVGRFVVYLAIAFCIGAIFALPQIMSLLSQTRATSGAYTPVLFSVKYYLEIAAELIGGKVNVRGIFIGALPAIAVIAFITCRKRFDRDEWRPWTIALALCAIGILVPFVGHAFNGMGYVNDRWMLIVGFVAAYVTCLVVPHIPQFDKDDWRRIGIGVGITALLALVYCGAPFLSGIGLRGLVMPVTMTVLFIVTFIVMRTLAGRIRPKAFAATAGALVVVCASMASCFYCSSYGDSFGKNFPAAGTAIAELTKNSPATPIAQLKDESDFRHSYPRVYGGMKNSSLLNGTMAIDFYSSLYNQPSDDLRKELGLSDHHLNYSFAGSDSRLAVEDLAGAKYYVWRRGDAWTVPYGFQKTNLGRNGYRISQNNHVAPIAYRADSIVPRSEYEQLSMAQKQEALMQSAVVDESKLAQAMPEANVEYASQKLKYKVVKRNGVKLENGTIHTTKEQASITLRFEGLEQSETYLCFENLHFEGTSPLDAVSEQGAQPNLKTFLNQLIWTAPNDFPITVSLGKRQKTFSPLTYRSISYGGKLDWVVNMGYSKKGATEMTVTFSRKGTYNFDSLSVVCQPTVPITSWADARTENALGNLSLDTNRMSASLELSDDSPTLAVFSFAYTPGWSVTVDGQPADVIKTNTAFMSVEVQGAGTHQIEWRYMTPGLPVGALLTLFGIVALIAIIFFETRVRGRRSK